MARIIAADADGVAEAAKLLEEGQVVVLPTETVYGLAARADRTEAVAQIYRIKGRPLFNPLIVHVANMAMAESLAVFDERARDLAERFWPGPLTLVLPARERSGIVAAVTAGLPTVAIRQPAHPVARAVLETVDLPLAAPSANRSFGISPTTAEHVISSLGDAAPPILDGGACEAGLESTIVALRSDDSWQLLRPGPISREALIDILGPEEKSRGATLEAPGQMAKHYSPGKPLRLQADTAGSEEFHISFGDADGDFSLSPTGNLAAAAARLYEALHAAAASARPKIAVAPIPDRGIGAAINDRLRRAAAT